LEELLKEHSDSNQKKQVILEFSDVNAGSVDNLVQKPEER